MPTISRTWVFAADTEGLVAVNDSAGNIPVNWDSTPQMLEFGATGATAGGFERARGPVTAGKDWTVLFPGLPAGATVTDIQCTAYKYQRFQSTSITNYRSRIRVVDSTGTSVHSAGDLADTTTAGATTDGAQVSGTVLASRSVDAGKQASTTIVALEVQLDRTAGTSGNDYDVDTIAITITYSLGGGIDYDVPIFWNELGPSEDFGPSPFSESYDIFAVGVAWTQSLSDTITLSDAAVKSMGLSKADTITLSDALSRVVGYQRSLADTITLSDGLSKALSLSKSDTITLSDSATKAMGLAKADSITLSDTLIKSMGLSKADTITLSETIAKAIGHVLSDSLGLSDSMSSSAAQNWTLSKSDVITLTDSIAIALNGTFVWPAGGTVGANVHRIILSKFGFH